MGTGDQLLNAERFTQRGLDALVNPDEALAHDAELAAADWRRSLGGVIGGGFDVAEPMALAAGRIAAVAAFVALQPLLVPPSPPSAATARELSSAIAAADDSYVAVLTGLRVECAKGAAADLAWLQAAVSAHGDVVATLAEVLGRSPRTARSVRMAGVRAAELIRRHCMLLAAQPVIERRVVDGRRAAGLAGIAGSRLELRRSPAAGNNAAWHAYGHLPGDRFVVGGYVVSTGWVDRQPIPYSFARFADSPIELRVHRRSMTAVGVAPGRHLWARAKLEPSSATPSVQLLVAEFEGISQHSGEVWEDWLATEARPAYDLAPYTLDVHWELPSPAFKAGLNELASRTTTDLMEVPE